VSVACTTSVADKVAGRGVVVQLEDATIGGQQLDSVAGAPAIAAVLALVVVLIFDVKDTAAEACDGSLDDNRERHDPSGRGRFARSLLVIMRDRGRAKGCPKSQDRSEGKPTVWTHAPVFLFAPEPAMNGGISLRSASNA